MSSRTSTAPVAWVTPDGSSGGDTSTTSKAATRSPRRASIASSSSENPGPPGSGLPVPGAAEGSRTSMSTVT